MALVPESVNRSIRISRARIRKRLYPASSKKRSRSSRVVCRSGSTLLMRNGSMMVRTSAPFLVRLCDYGAAIHRLAGNDALARAIVFIHERNVAHRGLELLQACVACGVVFDMGHDELAAALFRCRLAENRLDLADR